MWCIFQFWPQNHDVIQTVDFANRSDHYFPTMSCSNAANPLTGRCLSHNRLFSLPIHQSVGHCDDIIAQVHSGRSLEQSVLSSAPSGRCLSGPPAAPLLQLGTGPTRPRTAWLPHSHFQHGIVVAGSALGPIEIFCGRKCHFLERCHPAKKAGERTIQAWPARHSVQHKTTAC